MNKEIINKTYFDRVRFLLDHIANLELSDCEVLTVLAILMLEERQELISIDNISGYLNKEIDEVDDAITLLTSKGYLMIEVVEDCVIFNVDAIFLEKPKANEAIKDIFELFEEEFRRPLTQPELVRLNEWLGMYSKEQLIYALREASIQNKLKFNYINGILVNQSHE